MRALRLLLATSCPHTVESHPHTSHRSLDIIHSISPLLGCPSSVVCHSSYLKNVLGLAANTATSLSLYSQALAYFMPLLGGFVSDSYWGKYPTIMRFSFVYILGSCALATSAFDGWAWLTYIALVLVAIGTGGIKPCVSAFGADQFSGEYARRVPRQQVEKEVSQFFHVFYFSINIGSVLSFILSPIFRSQVGYWLAFGMPAVFLCIATFVFWMGRDNYLKFPATGSVITPMVRAFREGWNHRHEARLQPGRTWLDTAVGHGGVQPGDVVNAKGFWRILPIYAVKPSAYSHTFYMFSSASFLTFLPSCVLNALLLLGDASLLDVVRSTVPTQHKQNHCTALPLHALLRATHSCMLFVSSHSDCRSNAWVLQAERMTLHGLQPEQITLANPVLVLLLIPVFEKYVYPWLAAHRIQFDEFRRIGVGIVLSVASFLVAAFVQSLIPDDPSQTGPSIFLQLPQYFLISVAEILISITALEFAYTQSPPALKSVITAVWLITTGAGNLLAGILWDVLGNRMTVVALNILFAALMLLDGIAFLHVSSNFVKQESQVGNLAAPTDAAADGGRSDGVAVAGVELGAAHGVDAYDAPEVRHEMAHVGGILNE